MASLKAIGALVQTLREDRGITQKELAKKLSTTQSAVARIESGRQNVSARTLTRISDVLESDVIRVSDKSLNLAIEGGRKLKGTVVTKTSKNGAVGLLCASLLNQNTTRLKGVPKIEEVNRIIEVLESIGVSVTWEGHDCLIRPPKKLSLTRINREAARRTRSIIMFIGPLLHLFSRFTLPQAGGCKLGSRTVRPHFFALEKFGVSLTPREGAYDIALQKKLSPATVVLYESSDTATENALMAAALIPGKTVLKFASANYQVQELCFFLEKAGVHIEGVGTTTLIVHGVETIDAPLEYHVSEDPTDTMFFIAAAAVTRSKITITRCPIDFLELELLVLEKMGFIYKASLPYTSYNGHTSLVDITTFPSRLIAPPEKVSARPYPGLNMDNLPFFAVIATQAEGQTLIHDWMYEKRAIYYTELDKLGAETVLADPHRIFITGPTPLRGAELICPPALRPATILLIAMLAAKGHSVLRNVYSINRGYEGLVRRLNALGAKIQILKGF